MTRESFYATKEHDKIRGSYRNIIFRNLVGLLHHSKLFFIFSSRMVGSVMLRAKRTHMHIVRTDISTYMRRTSWWLNGCQFTPIYIHICRLAHVHTGSVCEIPLLWRAWPTNSNCWKVRLAPRYVRIRKLLTWYEPMSFVLINIPMPWVRDKLPCLLNITWEFCPVTDLLGFFSVYIDT